MRTRDIPSHSILGLVSLLGVLVNSHILERIMSKKNKNFFEDDFEFRKIRKVEGKKKVNLKRFMEYYDSGEIDEVELEEMLEDEQHRIRNR
jgi:regulator of sigma D